MLGLNLLEVLLVTTQGMLETFLQIIPAWLVHQFLDCQRKNYAGIFPIFLITQNKLESPRIGPNNQSAGKQIGMKSPLQ